MKVSVHAARRFLERVINKNDYNYFDVGKTIKYLERVFKDVVPNSANKHFAVPGFKNFKAVYCQNTIVTIVPKGKRVK